METLIHDVRYGLRMLGKSPGFTAVAVLTLALGFGANAAIFSIVNAVLLRPLPYHDPDRLVAVAHLSQRLPQGGAGGSASYPDFFDWRAQNHSFESLASYYDSEFALTGAGQPLHLSGQVVSADFFSVLGTPPERGRGFRREDEIPGTRVAVISHELWQSVLEADPDVLNHAITLNQQRYQVVGVMPPGFAFPIQAEAPRLWISLARDNEPAGSDPPQSSERGAHFLQVIGRLRSGVSLAQAGEDMNRIAQALARQFPDTNAHFSAVSVTSELESMVGGTRSALVLLLGAVGCVLLIACANVANLLLSRAGARTREMAVRGALGATRGRVVRQLFTESLLLALAGALVALPVAAWGIRLFLWINVRDISRLQTTSFDGWVLAFTCALAMLTSVVFGLTPALRAARPDLVQSLKEAGRAGSGGGISHQRLRAALVIAETAIGLVLLVSAGLLLRTFQHLLHADPGFDPKGVLALNFDLPDARYNLDQQVKFYDELLSNLRAMPGVTSAAAIDAAPLSGNGFLIRFAIEGRPMPPSQRPTAALSVISPGYFRTMGIPLLVGRDFSERDAAQGPGVLIVSQAFAQKYFPGEDPLGKHVRVGFAVTGKPIMREIVGVAGNVKRSGVDIAPRPEYYVPYAQTVVPLTILVKSAGAAPLSLVAGVRDQISRMDAELPLYGVRPMEDYVAASMGQRRFQAFLFGTFGALALVLTAVGLYGVMAYSVAQRTHEIGIRMSLGATGMDVLIMVLKSALRMTGAGLAAGIGAALVLTRFLEGMLFGVQRVDPITFTAVTLMLLVVALVASYIPARRATRVDPMVALRCE